MKKSILILISFAVIGCSKTPTSTPTPTPFVYIDGKGYAVKYATFQSNGSDQKYFAVVGDSFSIGLTYKDLANDTFFASAVEYKQQGSTLYSHSMNFANKLRRLYKVNPNVFLNPDNTYTISDTFYTYKTNSNVAGIDSNKYKIVITNVIAK